MATENKACDRPGCACRAGQPAALQPRRRWRRHGAVRKATPLAAGGGAGTAPFTDLAALLIASMMQDQEQPSGSFLGTLVVIVLIVLLILFLRR
jgi:hypothetical protein